MADIGNKFWARIDWYIIRLREGKEPDRTVAERQLITATDNIEQEEKTRFDQKKHRSENASEEVTEQSVTVIQSIFRMRSQRAIYRKYRSTLADEVMDQSATVIQSIFWMRSQRAIYRKHQPTVVRTRLMVRSRFPPRRKDNEHMDVTVNNGHDDVTNPGKDMVGSDPTMQSESTPTAKDVPTQGKLVLASTPHVGMDGLVQRDRGVDVTNLHDRAGRDQDGGKGYAVNETTIAVGNKDDETTNQPNAGIGKGIKGGDIDG